MVKKRSSVCCMSFPHRMPCFCCHLPWTQNSRPAQHLCILIHTVDAVPSFLPRIHISFDVTWYMMCRRLRSVLYVAPRPSKYVWTIQRDWSCTSTRAPFILLFIRYLVQSLFLIEFALYTARNGSVDTTLCTANCKLLVR